MKSTKMSLWASGLSLLVCCAMLVGTTFAWFTDHVVNTGNTITAGTLDVSLQYKHLTDIDAQYADVKSDTPLFNAADILWEPGRSYGYDFRVANNGSLALTYVLNFQNVVTGGGTDGANIADVLDVYYVSDVNATSLDGLTPVGTLAEVMNGQKAVTSGGLAANAAAQEFSVVVKMKEKADNKYQGAYATFTVELLAKQATAEQDGFGSSDYDEDAEYPTMQDNGNGTYTFDGNLYVYVSNQYIPVTADGAVNGLYTDVNGNNYVAEAEAVKTVFANAQDGENITFIDNVSISSIGADTYITAKNVTIDLNGRTVSVDLGTAENSFSVTGDGSVVKNGTFTCTGSRANYPLWITGNSPDRASILVENVTIEGGMQVTGTVDATLKNVTITANTWHDVYLAQDSSVTVESGTFTSTGSQPHFYFFNYGSSYNPTVTINGGEFNGDTPTYAVRFPGNPYTFTNNLG